MKAISIILAVYNVAPYILKCLNSIREQTFRDYQLILIDDCGTDDSIFLAESFLSATDIDYLVIHNERNIGVSACREAGVAAAGSAFILFIDPDDWIENTMLESLYQAAITNNADIVAYNGIEYYEQDSTSKPMPSISGIYEPGQYLGRLFNGDTTAHMWLRMIKKDLYSGLSFPRQVIFEDFLIVPLLISKANIVVHLDKALYHYVQRGSGGNLTTGRPPNIRGFLEYLSFFEQQLMAYNYTGGKELVKKYELALLSFILSRLFRSGSRQEHIKDDINRIRDYINIKDLILVRNIMNRKAWLLLLFTKLSGSISGHLFNRYNAAKNKPEKR